MISWSVERTVLRSDALRRSSPGRSKGAGAGVESSGVA